MDPVIDLAVKGLKQAAVRFRRNKWSALRTEVGSGDKNCRDSVPNDRVYFFEVLNSDLTLAFKYVPDIITPRNGRHIPFGYIPNATRIF